MINTQWTNIFDLGEPLTTSLLQFSSITIVKAEHAGRTQAVLSLPVSILLFSFRIGFIRRFRVPFVAAVSAIWTAYVSITRGDTDMGEALEAPADLLELEVCEK